jgi:glucosamine-6-phosphate deaminase
MIKFMDGKLKVLIYQDVALLAKAVANTVRNTINSMLKEKDEINIVFSGAKSQQAFHVELAKFKDIDWKRINAYAVDEFYCPRMSAEYTVAQQPIRDLYSVVSPRSVNIMNYKADDPETERKRYEDLIRSHPADIACLGIGISGHIALNEPGQTNFNDELSVRVVNITEKSKHQLMNDANFMKLGFIPDKGITITLSELMRCPNIYVIVPFIEKAGIVKEFFENGITADLPASIVKNKENAVMFLDYNSYGLCKK